MIINKIHLSNAFILKNQKFWALTEADGLYHIVVKQNSRPQPRSNLGREQHASADESTWQGLYWLTEEFHKGRQLAP